MLHHIVRWLIDCLPPVPQDKEEEREIEDEIPVPVIRFASLEDTKQLAEIDRLSGQEDIWTLSHFHNVISSPRYFILVHELEGEILGYLCFYQKKTHNILVSIAVKEPYRRDGIGTWLVDVLKTPAPYYRPVIVTTVRAHDLVGQLFLKRNSFACIDILEDEFENPVDDGYAFEWKDN